MSAPDAAAPTANPAPAGAPASDPNAPPQQGQPQAEEQDEAAEEQDRPQDAWSSRRELAHHAPPALRIGSGAGFGGALVTGDQHGVSGGRVAGDVIMGSKTEIWQLGPPPPHASGEVPAARLERLAESFVTDEGPFEALAGRLREERVLVVRGAASTGRRTAALMLLRRAARPPSVPCCATARPRSWPRNSTRSSSAPSGTGPRTRRPRARSATCCAT